VVSEPVERDPDHVARLLRSAGWDLGDPHHHLHDLRELDVASYDAGLLGALEQGLPGRVQRRAADLEERGAQVHVVEQLVGQRPLRGHVRQNALEPAAERLPRLCLVQPLGRATHLLDLVDVERL
jgi:hypothetical protein